MAHVIEKVSFFSAGLKLAGVLHIPSDYRAGEKRPAVIICHGFASVKEIHPPPIAAELNSYGYVALSFDFRGFGESEGRRGVLKPMEHVEDMINAVTFIAERPEVDPRKIAIFGASFGGSEAVVAAAMDQRIRAVVCTVALGDCERWLKALRSWREWRRLLERYEADRRKRVLTGEYGYIEIPELLNLDPGLRAEFEKRVQQYPTWSINIAIESIEPILQFKPEEYAHRVSPRGLLFVSTTNDEVVPPDESRIMYEKARDPKRLVVLEGAHYDVYVHPLLKEVIRHSHHWYQKFI